MVLTSHRLPFMHKYNHIDIEQLEMVSDGDFELLSNLVMMFKTQSVAYAQQLQQLLDSKDFYALGKLAHKIKGSVSTVGITPLIEIMKNLEHKVENGVIERECQELIDQYNSISQLALEELNHYVKNNPKSKSI